MSYRHNFLVFFVTSLERHKVSVHISDLFKNQIWILCQNSLTTELKIRVVGFVLKKLLTYFEMLIVPHALQCVDCCFLYFTAFDILLLAY